MLGGISAASRLHLGGISAASRGQAAYLKLRQLIDAGVRFVGHGLKTDFEMINVVVPKEQVLDTVELFYLEGSRRISLRFLAWHLLGEAMANRAQDIHDSIEDARTALALYDKYEELKAKGLLEETINSLYDVGRDTHWEVPDVHHDAFVPPPQL